MMHTNLLRRKRREAFVRPVDSFAKISIGLAGLPMRVTNCALSVCVGLKLMRFDTLAFRSCVLLSLIIVAVVFSGSIEATPVVEANGTEFLPLFFGLKLKITDTIVALSTLLTFLATFALYLATRDLVRGADQTSRRQLRAYVGTFEIGFLSRMPVEVVVKIKNFGATPAYNFRTAIWLSTNAIPDNGYVANQRSTLWPGSISVVHCVFPAMTVVGMQDLILGNSSLWLHGTILYEDAFGVERFTNIRLVARGHRVQTQNSFIDAGEGNDSN